MNTLFCLFSGLIHPSAPSSGWALKPWLSLGLLAAAVGHGYTVASLPESWREANSPA
jgi:hypothetical protein